MDVTRTLLELHTAFVLGKAQRFLGAPDDATLTDVFEAEVDIAFLRTQASLVLLAQDELDSVVSSVLSLQDMLSTPKHPLLPAHLFNERAFFAIEYFSSSLLLLLLKVCHSPCHQSQR